MVVVGFLSENLCYTYISITRRICDGKKAVFTSSGCSSIDESDPEQANLTINGGEMNLSTNSDKGNAGLVAGNQLIINHGNLSVTNSYEGYVGKHVTINGEVQMMELSPKILFMKKVLCQMLISL